MRFYKVTTADQSPEWVSTKNNAEWKAKRGGGTVEEFEIDNGSRHSLNLEDVIGFLNKCDAKR